MRYISVNHISVINMDVGAVRMPVRMKHEVRCLTQHEFSVVAYEVMGKLFEIHEDFGRLFDELIYRRNCSGGCRRRMVKF